MCRLIIIFFILLFSFDCWAQSFFEFEDNYEEYIQYDKELTNDRQYSFICLLLPKIDMSLNYQIDNHKNFEITITLTWDWDRIIYSDYFQYIDGNFEHDELFLISKDFNKISKNNTQINQSSKKNIISFLVNGVLQKEKAIIKRNYYESIKIGGIR